MMQIGVFLLSLDRDYRVALAKAQDIGLAGVQLWNVDGPLSPRVITREFRRELPKIIARHGLFISALCAHMSLTEAAGLVERLTLFEEIIDLCADWGVPVVTSESGAIDPKQSAEEAWSVLERACERLLKRATKHGVYVAIEPGGGCLVGKTESALRLMRTFQGGHLRLNYDPANAVVNGDDPLQALDILGDWIVHTHAKDAKRSPQGVKEVRLGTGDVPWDQYLGKLKAIGFAGWLAIEREYDNTRMEDIAYAKEILRKGLARLCKG